MGLPKSFPCCHWLGTLMGNVPWDQMWSWIQRGSIWAISQPCSQWQEVWSVYFHGHHSVQNQNKFWVFLGVHARASLVAQPLKNPPAMQEIRVWSLDWEDPLEKQKATYSSSVYSCDLFLISSASVRSLSLLSFTVPTLARNVPLVSPIVLKRSLVFPILLFSSISLHDRGRRLSYLFLLFFGTLHSDAYIFPFLLCFSPLFFSQLFVRPPHIAITWHPNCLSLGLNALFGLKPMNEECVFFMMHFLSFSSELCLKMVIHSSILISKISWMEPGGLQLMVLQRVRHEWVHTHNELS